MLYNVKIDIFNNVTNLAGRPVMGDVLNIYTFEGRSLIINKGMMKLFKEEEIFNGG